jgi:S1-C subfamily serine protease
VRSPDAWRGDESDWLRTDIDEILADDSLAASPSPSAPSAGSSTGSAGSLSKRGTDERSASRENHPTAGPAKGRVRKTKERAEKPPSRRARKEAQRRASSTPREDSGGRTRAASAAAAGSARRNGKGTRRDSGSGGRRRGRKDYRRIRIFPRSVIGICVMLLAAGIGAAISGTVLFMQYQYRRDVSDAKVVGFDERIANGQKLIEAEGINAQARIQKELEPLLKQAAIGETLERILADASPAVWASDVNGAPIVGTGFVVASDSEKSFLVTSLAVVQASTVRPGPALVVRKGADELEATLWTWQEERDLALLIIQKGDLPKLKWAEAADTRVGTQVFAMSGLGTAGGAVTNGFVADVSASGLQHTAPIGTAFQGGPILNERGLVVAVGSRAYAPLGFASDGVWFATPVSTTCEKLVRCPSGGGQVTGAGSQR